MTTIHQHFGSVLSWPLSPVTSSQWRAAPSTTSAQSSRSLRARCLFQELRTRWKINIHRLMRGINMNFILPLFLPIHSSAVRTPLVGHLEIPSTRMLEMVPCHILHQASNHNPEMNWVPSSRTWRWCNTDCSWMASVQIRRAQLSVLVLYLSTTSTARILVGELLILRMLSYSPHITG